MINEADLKKAENIHFVGIGGIGMSALARMMISLGKKISGSDRSASPITEELEKIGISISFEEDPDDVFTDIDVVIYTVALSEDHPELLRARQLDIPTITYPQALGLISKEFYTIAVSGTHGKTTTTAMIAEIMIDAGLSPTVIVGSLLKKYKSNFVAGTGKYLVVEACEYKRSFLNINPKVAVVTNIEEDHLDYYKDIADIREAFTEFVSKAEEIVYPIEETDFIEAVASEKNISHRSYSSFLKEVPPLKVPGIHNEKNAAAALAVASHLGIPLDQASKTLEAFEGTWRRSEQKGVLSGGEAEKIVFDDYAHHPTEIQATLTAFREKFPNHYFLVVFQPHLYSRTKSLFDDFVKSFDSADKVLFLPIYAAREKEDITISSDLLAEKVRERDVDAESVASFAAALSAVRELPDIDTIILTMGAGDVYKVGEELL